MLPGSARDRPGRPAPGPVGADADDWFELTPVGMLVYERSGRIVRRNASAVALLGAAPQCLQDAGADLQRLLGWSGGAPLGQLQPGAPVLQVWSTMRAADGRSLHLCARLRALRGVGSRQRVLAVIEDRSVEDERDLAQLEIGALIDTAGVGVATYEPSRGWSRSRSAPSVDGRPGPAGVAQSIGRDQVDDGSLAEFDRLQQALRRGERAQVRYQVRVPGLGRRWLLTRVEPGELAGGRAALSVVTLDVTEQEQAHRRNERLLLELSAILDGTSAGMAYLRDERLVRCNRRFEAMLGRPVGGAGGATLGELFAGHEALLARVRAALRDGDRFETELRLGDRWVALSLRRVATGDDGDGAPAALVCSFVDIDELRGAREALALQAERTRVILDSVLVGIVTVGDAGIEWMNRSARRMFGGELGDFVGQPMSIVASGDAGHPLRATHYLAALADGQAENFECRLRALDGREFWVAGNAVVTGREGAGRQLTFALLDIDERRTAERARFDAALAQRELLVKEVHHRIKNNLQGVAGLLQHSAARRPEVAALIGEVVGQVQAIAQVHGLQVGLSGPLPIAPLIEAITASVQRTFGRAIAVELAGGDARRCALPEAESIPVALTVNELLTNAVKHGAPGPIECTLCVADDAVSIAVRSPGRLREGFSLAQVPPGVSGLGLVRALLPRRSATLQLEQCGDAVRAEVRLRPPSFSVIDPG